MLDHLPTEDRDLAVATTKVDPSEALYGHPLHVLSAEDLNLRRSVCKGRLGSFFLMEGARVVF